MGDLGPLLLAVEAGTLTAQVDGQAVLTRGAADGVGSPQSTTAPLGAEIVLHPGDGLLVSPGVRHAFRNAEQTPTVVLAVTLLPWSSGAPEGNAFLWPIPGAPDITAQLLIDEVAPVLPTGPAAIALGRLALAGEVGLAPGAATGPRFAFVEAGTLRVDTAGGGPDVVISAGSEALVPRSSVATSRNGGDGPLVVLLVTITPEVPRTAPGERALSQ
jgi:mannose-6-phosphate isomerase-like protein (cupin superfamily)